MSILSKWREQKASVRRLEQNKEFIATQEQAERQVRKKEYRAFVDRIVIYPGTFTQYVAANGPAEALRLFNDDGTPRANQGMAIGFDEDDLQEYIKAVPHLVSKWDLASLYKEGIDAIVGAQRQEYQSTRFDQTPFGIERCRVLYYGTPVHAVKQTTE